MASALLRGKSKNPVVIDLGHMTLEEFDKKVKHLRDLYDGHQGVEIKRSESHARQHVDFFAPPGMYEAVESTLRACHLAYR